MINFLRNRKKKQLRHQREHQLRKVREYARKNNRINLTDSQLGLLSGDAIDFILMNHVLTEVHFDAMGVTAEDHIDQAWDETVQEAQQDARELAAATAESYEDERPNFMDTPVVESEPETTRTYNGSWESGSFSSHCFSRDRCRTY